MIQAATGLPATEGWTPISLPGTGGLSFKAMESRMFEPGAPLTIHDVLAKLESLKTVGLEHIDSEGVPLNHPDVYKGLAEEDQLSVDEACSEATKYLEQNPRRSETELSNHGHLTGVTDHPNDEFAYFAQIEIPAADENRYLQLGFPK